MMKQSALLLLVAVVMAGCTPRPTLYDWGEYEDKLHAVYENPAEIPGFHEELKSLIEECEREGRNPPPGIYAEYGYALYLNEETDQAVVYFTRERDTWPESAVLMTVVIDRLQARRGRSGAGTNSAPENDESGVNP